MFSLSRRLRCPPTAAAAAAAAASSSFVVPSSSTTNKTIKIHGDKIGNRFAEKPHQHTPRWVLNEAAEKHKGWGVYQTRKQVIEVLQAVRVSKPIWWCSACDDVLARMLNLRQSMNWGATSSARGAIIVIEGLDGVGKSTVTQALASERALEDADEILADEEENSEENNNSIRSIIGSSNSFFGDSRSNDFISKNHSESQKNFSAKKKKNKEEEEKLKKEKDMDEEKQKIIETVIPGALLMRTPDPCLDTARAKFRVMEEPVARAFYCAANYITADAVMRYSSEGRVVVLDRWWNSTCAMALSARSMALAQMTIKQEQKHIEDMMRKKEMRLKSLTPPSEQQKEKSNESNNNDNNSSTDNDATQQKATSSDSSAAKVKFVISSVIKNILSPNAAENVANSANAANNNNTSEDANNNTTKSTSTTSSTSSSSSSSTTTKETAPSSIWSRYFGQDSLLKKEVEKMEELEMTRDLIMNPPESLERQLMFDLLPPEDNKIYCWPSDLPHVDLRILLDVSEEIRKKRMAKRGDENQEEKVLAEKRALRDTAMEAYRRMTPELKVVQVPNYAQAVNEIVDMIENSKELTRLMPKGMPKKYSKDFVDSIKPY